MQKIVVLTNTKHNIMLTLVSRSHLNIFFKLLYDHKMLNAKFDNTNKNETMVEREKILNNVEIFK